MSYSSEVLADSPWGYWETTETSGSTFADSSGNSRPMTEGGVGTAPTLAQTGPDGTGCAVSWPATTNGSYGITTAGVTTSPVTVEAWVYITALPSLSTAVVACAVSAGSSTNDKILYIDTAGKVHWYVFNGSNQNLASSAALSLNAWHHVIASTGAAGSKIRVDKSTVASSAVTSSYTGSAQKVFMRGGGDSAQGDFLQAGAVLIAKPAFYPAQLSDTRTDAHYDAMLTRTVTVTAPAATATATALAPTVSAVRNVTMQPPAATATAAALAPAVVTSGDVVIQPPAATATAAALAPSVTAQRNVTLSPPAATATADALAPTVVISGAGDVTILARPATATAVAIRPLILTNTARPVDDNLANCGALMLSGWSTTYYEVDPPGGDRADIPAVHFEPE